MKTPVPWEPKLLPHVQAWLAVSDADNVVAEQRPHDDEAWRAYLQWYLVRIRTRVMFGPPELQEEPEPEAVASQGYPVRRDQTSATAVSFKLQIRHSFFDYVRSN